MSGNARPAVLAALRALTVRHGSAELRLVAAEAAVSEETARHHLGTLIHRDLAARYRHGGGLPYRYRALAVNGWRPANLAAAVDAP